MKQLVNFVFHKISLLVAAFVDIALSSYYKRQRMTHKKLVLHARITMRWRSGLTKCSFNSLNHHLRLNKSFIWQRCLKFGVRAY